MMCPRQRTSQEGEQRRHYQQPVLRQPFIDGCTHFLDRRAVVREAQRQVTNKDPLTDLVCTIDIGSFSNVHPENKFDATSRIASSILANMGVAGAVKTGPTFKEVSRGVGHLCIACLCSGWRMQCDVQQMWPHVDSCECQIVTVTNGHVAG